MLLQKKSWMSLGLNGFNRGKVEAAEGWIESRGSLPQKLSDVEEM